MKFAGESYKNKIMKNLYFILIASLFFFSCEKRKEIREWKKKEGVYKTETDYLLYQDSQFNLRAKEIQIGQKGFVCYGSEENQPGTSFGAFHKEENPKKEYDYKCQYSKITSYALANNSSEAYLSSENFEQGREFYITFSGSSSLIFTIIHQDGTIEDVRYEKVD